MPVPGSRSVATAMSATRDVDWVVIGSGFGGSVAALRLAQKGYSVRVLESGWRFGDQDFAGSTWDARRYFFAPRLGLRGIMRLTPFPDVLIASGAGVGGGSLGLREHALPRPRRVLRGPAVARAGRLEGRAGRALPDRGADARRHRRDV